MILLYVKQAMCCTHAAVVLRRLVQKKDIFTKRVIYLNFFTIKTNVFLSISHRGEMPALTFSLSIISSRASPSPTKSCLLACQSAIFFSRLIGPETNLLAHSGHKLPAQLNQQIHQDLNACAAHLCIYICRSLNILQMELLAQCPVSNDEK